MYLIYAFPNIRKVGKFVACLASGSKPPDSLTGTEGKGVGPTSPRLSL